ncbi:MAG TPA: hypothetical protein VIK24_08100, partial [Pyrinomonadaceae bacterium]
LKRGGSEWHRLQSVSLHNAALSPELAAYHLRRASDQFINGIPFLPIRNLLHIFFMRGDDDV